MKDDRWLAGVFVFLIALATTAEVASQQSSRPLGEAARAFWASPSISSFLDYGHVLTTFLATEDHRQREDAAGKPLRPSYPDYETMKRLLEGGLIPKPSPLRSVNADAGLPASAMGRVSLPQVRASVLRPGDLVYVMPLMPFTLSDAGPGMVDALSAFHQVPLRARVLEGAMQGQNSVMGAWDVGVLGVTFEQPVIVHGVTADGSATGASISSIKVNAYGYCSDSPLEVASTPLNSRWRTAVVAWIGRAIPSTNQIATSTVLTGTTAYDKLVVDDIDLNGDRIPDFWILSGTNPPDISTETHWRAVFANVGGRWVRAGFSQEPDCT